MSSSRDVLWDVPTLSHAIKKSKSWIYHQVALGNLPCIRIGRALRFEPDTILKHFGVGTTNTDANVVRLDARRSQGGRNR